MRQAIGDLQAGRPQRDSVGGTGAGPGNIDPKRLRELSENWGKLPEQERAKIISELADRGMPPGYRDAVSDYLARVNASMDDKDPILTKGIADTRRLQDDLRDVTRPQENARLLNDRKHKSSESSQRNTKDAARDETAIDVDRMVSETREFRNNLLVLKARLERSELKEDRARAETIDRALSRLDKGRIDSKLKMAIEDLRKDEHFTPQQLEKSIESNRDIQVEIRRLITVLGIDDKGSGSATPEVWHAEPRRPTVARVYLGDKNTLMLISLQVTVSVDGPRARTVVDHIFYNPHDRQLEGTFEYPLPTGSSPSYFAMFLGRTRNNVPERFARRENKPVPSLETLVSMPPAQLVEHVNTEEWGKLQQAKIVAKEKGLETYEEITRQRIDPALLEYAGGNNFSGRVFPIPPRGYNRVILAYEETLPVVGGMSTYRFPLPDGKLNDLSFTLQGDTEQCPNAKFRPEPDQMSVGSRTYVNKVWKEKGPGGDAVFTFKLPDPGLQVISGRDGPDGPIYLFARLRPNIKAEQSGPFAENAVFLVDTSLNDQPGQLDVHMKLLRKILEKDPDIKRFNILTYSVCSAWVEPNGWLDNTSDGRKRAFDRLDGLLLEGASDIGEVLDRLAAGPPHRGSAIGPVNVFLLSDGQATWGERATERLAHRFSERCKFPVLFHCYRTGLSAENQELFDALARKGGGVFQCHSTNDIEAAALAHRNQSLQITSLRIEGEPHAADVMIAGRQAKVYPGGDVVVAARLDKPGDAKIILEGRFQGKDFRQEYPVIVDTSSVLAPRAWAEVAVASLLALNDPKLDNVIVAYCQRYAVGSRLASFLVLENDSDYARFNLEVESEQTVKGDLGRFLETSWKEAGQVVSPLAEFQLLLKQLSPHKSALEGVEGKPVRQLMQMLTERDFEVPTPEVSRGPSMKKDVPPAYLTALQDCGQDASALLDEAQRRMDHEDANGALCVLSNVIKHYPYRSDALRWVGYRLLDMKQSAQALPLFRQVQHDRPFEPHSYRDLARGLEDCCKFPAAALMYEFILAGQWDGRFRSDLKTLVREEYTHMLRLAIQDKAVTVKVADFFAQRLETLAAGIKPCDLRVTITWNTDNTDVDLWVFEPDGTKCFYGHRKTNNGGELSEDCTRGYGPERFQVQHAVSGEYCIAVHYCGVNRNLLGGETQVQVVITRNAGTAEETSTRQTVVLKKQGDVIEVGRVKF
jgi:hypothetical protein